jgi:hypothetical protein
MFLNSKIEDKDNVPIDIPLINLPKVLREWNFDFRTEVFT